MARLIRAQRCTLLVFLTAIFTMIFLSTVIALGQALSGDSTPARQVAIARSTYIDLSTPDSARKAMVVMPEESERANRYDAPTMRPFYNFQNPSESGSARVVITAHWINDPLPVATSDIVVIGTVISASPHLSKSGSGIYTTFIFTPDTFLKTQNRPPQSSLLLERFGGVILYPSKEKRFIGVKGRALPEPNYKYLLFLKLIGTSGSYEILSGYALVDNHVISLEPDGKALESLSMAELISRTKLLVSTP